MYAAARVCIVLLFASTPFRPTEQTETNLLSARPVLQTTPQARLSFGMVMEPMPLVAPFFVDEGLVTSELVLANSTILNAGATITTRGLHGEQTGSLHLVLKPHDNRKLTPAELQENTGFNTSLGSISVQPDPDLKGPAIAGRLLITDRRNSTPAYLDEELAVPDAEGSSILRTVTDDFQGTHP